MADLRDAMIGVDSEVSMPRPPTRSTNFLPANPFRPPDWRWHRAGPSSSRALAAIDWTTTGPTGPTLGGPAGPR